MFFLVIEKKILSIPVTDPEIYSFFHSRGKFETWYKHITPVYRKAVPAFIYTVLYLLGGLKAFDWKGRD